METSNEAMDKVQISGKKALSLISQLMGNQGYPNPDSPLPSGPWDPYIRKAANRIGLWGPHPEPWQFAHILRIHPEIWDQIHPHSYAAPDTQRLPPRFVFIAALTQEVVDRAILLQEIKDAVNHNNNERGIIIVSGDIEKFTDEFEELCHRIDIILNIHPGKGDVDHPRPNWNPKAFTALEYFAAAATLYENALNIRNESLRQQIYRAGEKLALSGIALP